MTNKMIGKLGAAIAGISTFAFAAAMIYGLFADGLFACCFSSIFIALGFILFISGISALNKDAERKAVSCASLISAAVYVVFVLIVYFAECTTINLHPELSDDVRKIIDYGNTGSLFFNYDLLGYAFMALSTFFGGFLVDKTKKCGKPLAIMLKIHGIFFLSCLFVPMFPVFTGVSGDAAVGTVLLEIWCLYFMPTCFFGYRYLGDKDDA